MTKRKKVKQKNLGFEEELEKDIKKIEKEIEQEFIYVENWVAERRKFFIKLGILIFFILMILLFLKAV